MMLRDYLPDGSGVDWKARYRRHFVRNVGSMPVIWREAEIFELCDMRAEFVETIFAR